MARFNEILVGRYNRFLQKLFSMKGPASLVTLSDEAFAHIVLSSGAENRYLEAWEYFGRSISVAAGGAGNFAAVRLRNPAGSNVIAVVFKATVTDGGPTTDNPSLQLQTINTDLATVSAADAHFDSRTRTQPTCQVSSQSGTGLGLLTRCQAGIQANATYDFVITDIQEYPLLPGDSTQILAGVANQAMVASFWWRERFLEDSERA